MALDLIRSCYTSFMRFWDGGQERMVKGRWFRVSDVAEDFPGPHSYASLRTYDREFINDGPGEDLRLPTRYDRGANTLGYRGDRFCGSREAFLTGGTWGVDPPILTDDVGYAPCCSGPPPGEGVLDVGGEAEFLAVNVDQGEARLVISGTGYADFLALMRGASSLTVTFDEPTIGVTLASSSTLEASFDEPTIGVTLASSSTLEASFDEPTIGVTLASSSTLEATIETGGGGETEPGDSCSEAPTLTVGTEYDFVMPATFLAEQWICWAPAAGSYHLTLSGTGGGESFCEVFQGASCASLGDGALKFDGCTNVTVSSGNKVFLQFINNDGVEYDWTVSLSSGSCP